MLKTRRIARIIFVVRDIDRTEMFYRETLGLPVERMKAERSAPERLIAPTLGGVNLHFVQGESMPGNSPILIVDLDENVPHRSAQDVDLRRRIGRLISAGCTPAEAQWLLGISSAAPYRRPDARSRVAGPAAPLPAPGNLRSHLLAAVRRIPSTHLGSHDQDGHLFLIRLSQSATRRQLRSGR